MNLTFTDENRFVLGPFSFVQEWTDRIDSLALSFPDFAIMKSRENIESYVRQFKSYGRPVTTLLELGVMKGGSCAFFNELVKPRLHISIDASPSVLPQLQELRKHAANQGRVYQHFPEVLQQETNRILSHIAHTASIGTQEVVLDWIIDDASHWYAPTRAAFNGLFPFLSEGGVYAIEDWAWAHWQPWQGPNAIWHSEPALTNLLFEICMAHATKPELIREVIVTPITVYVIRGKLVVRDQPFDIGSHFVARGRTLVPI